MIFIIALAPAHAVSNAGTTGASFLELGIGARAAAMGEANTAWSDDVYGMYFNPAGIARNRRQEVGFLHNTMYSDLSYSYLGYVMPVKNAGVWALSGIFVDLGTVDRTTIASGVANTVIGKAGASDLAVSLTYARAISRTLDIGGTIKVIHEKLDRYSATAAAVDFGVRWYQPVEGLSIGVSVANVGSRLQFVRESEELPLSMRIGLAYRAPNGVWGAAGDLVWVSNQDVEAKFGGEFWVWPKHLALRAGFNTANDLTSSGVTAGAAFHWDDLAVDYAFVPSGEIGDQNLVSLTYLFGPERVPHGWEKQPAADAPVIPTAAPTREEPRRVEPVVVSPRVSEVEVVVVDPPPVEPQRPVEPPTPVVAPEVPARVFVSGGFYVAPFGYTSGPDNHDWMAPATTEIFRQDWRGSGLVDDPANAVYYLIGEVNATDEMFVISAQLIRRAEVIATFESYGSVAAPFAAWDRLLVNVNMKLAEESGSGGMSTNLPVDRSRFAW